MFSVQDADARLKLEALLAECETAPAASGLVGAAIIQALIGVIVRRLLERKDAPPA